MYPAFWAAYPNSQGAHRARPGFEGVGMLQQNPDSAAREPVDADPQLPVVPFRVARRDPKAVCGPAPWGKAFEVTPGLPGAPDAILLAQITDREFLLGSRIRFRDEFPTGLEDLVSRQTIGAIREVGPATLTDTDLGSIPGVFGWFLASYGRHTPAVLIHDRLIGWDSPPTNEVWLDQYADRYLRFMLKASGMSWLTRWLMWTAVAFRTRWVAEERRARRRLGLILWGGAATVGIASAAIALIQFSWGLPALIAVALPWPAALLWGKQYGAGLIAVVCGPLVLPPALAGLVGYGAYWMADKASTAFGSLVRRLRRRAITAIPSA
jgi:hypothetical protein